MPARQREPELMDQPGLDAELHRQALRALRRVNRLCRTAAYLWEPIRQLANEQAGRPIRVLDVACGGGDVALDLARRVTSARLNVHVDGCDISPTAVDHATRAAQAGAVTNTRFFTCDLLHDRLADSYEVVTCTLFLHHLDDDDALTLLRRMSEIARQLVLVDDLRRTRLGYFLAWCGCRALTRSAIVHTDGPRSVAAAYTSREAEQLARQAGWTSATSRHHWPERFLLAWRKE